MLKQTIKVLVSGVGGDVAQGIIKCLELSNLDIEIYKICVSSKSSWLYKDNKSYIVPFSSDDNYITTLLKIIKKHSIDIFIPTVDNEIPIISNNKSYLESESKVKVFVDDIEKIEYCDDKYLTYQFLKQHSFSTPLTIVPVNKKEVNDFLSKTTYPILSKPRRGRGAVNIITIRTKEEAYLWIRNETVILQEYLDGEEYTTGIYLGDDLEVKGICTLKRELKGGTTFKAERVIDKALELELEIIAKKLKIKYLNIQSRLVNNKLVPFEFNGRFSGTTGIISRVFNAPEMYIKEKFLNQNIERVNSEVIFHVMRYYEEIYSDTQQTEDLINRSNEL